MSDQGRDDFAARTGVSRETLARFDAYAQALQQWNPRINLVSRKTLNALWARHFLDSAQLLDHAPNNTRLWADLGSGGGFPGMVVAILAREKRPGLRVHLVEADARKAAFLRHVAALTEAPAQVHIARAEELPPLNAQVVSARALAPLPRLLPLVARHLAPQGRALLLKGRGWRQELEDCQVAGLGSFKVHPSITDPESAVLEHVRQR